MRCKLSVKDFLRNTVLPVKNRQTVYALANVGLLNIVQEGRRKMVEVDQKYLKSDVEISSVNTKRTKRNKKTTLILPTIVVDMLLTVIKKKNITLDDYLRYVTNKYNYLLGIFANENKVERFQINVSDDFVEVCNKMYDCIKQVKNENVNNRKKNIRLGTMSLMFMMFVMFDLFGKLYPEEMLISSKKNQINQN